MPGSNNLDFLTDHVEIVPALFIGGRYQPLFAKLTPNPIKRLLWIGNWFYTPNIKRTNLVSNDNLQIVKRGHFV